MTSPDPTDAATSLSGWLVNGRRWLRSHLLRQVARLSFGRIIAALISAVWMIIAARRLSVHAFGDLALILAVGTIFTSIADFGLPSLLADAVGRQPAVARDAYLSTVRIRLGLGVVGALAVGGAYRVAASDNRAIIPLVFSASLIATTIYSSAYALFLAQGRVGFEAGNEIVSRLFVLGLGGWLLFHGAGLLAAVAVYALADVLSAVALGVVAMVTTTQARQPVAAGSLSMRRAVPLALTGWVGTLYYRIDVYILALLAGTGAVGLYASCYRIFDALLLPATACSSLAVPLTARLERQPRNRRLAELSAIALIVTIPAGALVAANASQLLRLLLGPQYGVAGRVLLVLLLGLISSVFVEVIGPKAALLNSWAISKALLACLAVDVVINLVAIPAYGAYAAAWATVASQTLLAALMVTVLLRYDVARGGRSKIGVAAQA